MRTRLSTLAALAALILPFSLFAQEIVIPASTPVVVRTSEAIDSRNADLAREYVAVLDEPLVVNGTMLADKGAEAVLRVAETTQAGAVRGRASLSLRLASVTIDGNRVPTVSGDVKSESGSQAGKATKSGIAGAAIGAIVGGVFGGGSGAATGAAIGGGAGVSAAALTGQRVQVPAETRLTFTLASPANVNAAPPASAAKPPSLALPPAPAPPPAAPPRELPRTVVDQVEFQVVEAVADGKLVRVTLTALNQGVDRRVDFSVPGGARIRLIDDFGNTYPDATVLVGNQRWQADLLNGVRTNVVITVDNLATVGGTMQANEIKRLTARVDIGKPGKLVLELRDIPIEK